MITELQRQIAHHEAAHAFTALHFGFNVSYVDIVGDANREGGTEISIPTYQYSGKKGKEYLSIVFDDAVVDCAGQAANEKFFNGAKRISGYQQIVVWRLRRWLF